MVKDCCEDGCDCDILPSLLAAFRLLLEVVARGCGADDEKATRGCECAEPAG
jgi:hypothetical protein